MPMNIEEEFINKTSSQTVEIPLFIFWIYKYFGSFFYVLIRLDCDKSKIVMEALREISKFKCACGPCL